MVQDEVRQTKISMVWCSRNLLLVVSTSDIWNALSVAVLRYEGWSWVQQVQVLTGELKQHSAVFISSLVVPLFHPIFVTLLSEHYHNNTRDCHWVCVEFQGLSASSDVGVFLMGLADLSTALSDLYCTCAVTGGVCVRACRVQWNCANTEPLCLLLETWLMIYL